MTAPAPPLSYQTPPPARHARRGGYRAWAVGLLLLLGGELWLLAGGGLGASQRVQSRLLAGAAAAWAVGLAALRAAPRLAARSSAAAARLRRPSAPARARTALALSLAATAYLIFTGFHQHRYLGPAWHDQFSYLIGARHLAAGRLWMPPHPLAAFFDSFYLVAEPVYASMYFPGTALFLAPALRLGLPPWLPMALAGGAAAGLLYRVVAELLDGAAGLLAALLLLATRRFRWAALAIMAQMPLLLLGLLLVWAWLRWRRRPPGRGRRWELAIGAFAGWAGITRPLDALAFVVPVAAAVAVRVLGRGGGQGGTNAGRGQGTSHGRSFALATKTSLLVFVGAAPFVALQLCFNAGVTGNILTTPFRYYADRDYPGTSLGFHAFDPAARPASPLPQKQAMYDGFRRDLRDHRPDNAAADFVQLRLPRLVAEALPNPLLLVLFPAALAAMDRRRLVLALSLPLFVGFYTFYVFFFAHYVVTALPAAALIPVLGLRAIRTAWPRAGRRLAPLAALLVIALALSAFPEVNRLVRDDDDPSDLRRIDAALARVGGPAVVLFRFGPRAEVETEPVYNAGVAWPDDAPVIRAHDLGDPADQRIYDYYATKDPSRVFYRYDRQAHELVELGRADELAPGTSRGRR